MPRRLSLVIGHWSLVILSSFVLRPSSLFAAEVASPLSPADAQKAFQLADASLRIELAAAEPEVIDPVAIRFDEDGRMWVAEMRDYPLGPPASSAGNVGPLSQIRVLEDRDSDGRYESATTFADKLSFVTGLQPWKGGVFVTLAGRVAYMKDTDGDGRSDVDETWYEGFAEQNTQLRANHPRLALDNHIYVANGLRGGKVVNRRLKDQPVIDISGMDFRFEPLTGKAEAVSGNGQFGLCFDDWGNRFTCTNRNPCRHVVIEDRYLRASPGVTVPAVMHDVAAFAENSRIFPISRAWTTSNLHAGTFTAACGVFIYRGDLLPAEFKGNVFTCDPTGNLIHREIMEPAGPTFTSKPAYEGKEFLASPDEWFRPVNLELGSDGALYVVDMYRCVIEHPDFVPDELKKRPDLRLGDDRGRIWRIVPAQTNPTRKRGSAAGKLSTAMSEELVPLLKHPNAWQRETAQRLLIERNSVEAAPALRELATSLLPAKARVHAFWLLIGWRSLAKDDLTKALFDHDSQFRRQALLATELPDNMHQLPPDVGAFLSGFHATDHFQARLTLCLLRKPVDKSREWIFGKDQVAAFFSDADDLWQRHSTVLFLSPNEATDVLMQWVLARRVAAEQRITAGEIALVERLSERSALDTRGPDRGLAAWRLDRLQPQEVGLAVLRGMSTVWVKKGINEGNGGPTGLAPWLMQIANDPVSSAENRTTAVSLLGIAADPVTNLVPFAQRDRAQAIRLAAISALARQPGTDHWLALLDGFASDTPAARRATLDGLLSNADRTTLLLDAIEAGKIKPSELDPTQAKRLTENRDASIKERAGKLFAAATPEDRVKALADYQISLEMKADAQRGTAIFEKNCAACHKIGTIGVNVAPDISDSRTKTAEQLLADIVQPNRAIDNNYLGYSGRLADGTVASGILTTETATSITLRQQGGKDLVVSRSEIEELKSSGISLMPEGLERQIPPQDMADLLAFIKNWRYLDGKTPLGSAEGRKQ